MEKVLLAPGEIKHAVVETGIKKVKRTKLQMFLLGIMAGVFIALACYVSNMAIHTMSADNYGLTRFVQGAVFPFGLILVLVAGADLFTGNTLIFLGVLEDEIRLSEMLRNWGIVYLGNLAGSLIVAWLVYQAGLFEISAGRLGELHVEIAANKTALEFNVGFIRGILANFLVCLAVWMGIGAKDMVGKVLASWFPIMAFVAGGFEHSIANMYYIPAGILARSNFAESSAATSAELASLNLSGLASNLLSTTVGNILGGGILLGIVYWLIYGELKTSSISKEKKLKVGNASYQTSAQK